MYGVPPGTNLDTNPYAQPGICPAYAMVPPHPWAQIQHTLLGTHLCGICICTDIRDNVCVGYSVGVVTPLPPQWQPTRACECDAPRTNYGHYRETVAAGQAKKWHTIVCLHFNITCMWHVMGGILCGGYTAGAGVTLELKCHPVRVSWSDVAHTCVPIFAICQAYDTRKFMGQNADFCQIAMNNLVPCARYGTKHMKLHNGPGM